MTSKVKVVVILVLGEKQRIEESMKVSRVLIMFLLVSRCWLHDCIWLLKNSLSHPLIICALFHIYSFL